MYNFMEYWLYKSEFGVLYGYICFTLLVVLFESSVTRLLFPSEVRQVSGACWRHWRPYKEQPRSDVQLSDGPARLAARARGHTGHLCR